MVPLNNVDFWFQDEGENRAKVTTGLWLVKRPLHLEPLKQQRFDYSEYPKHTCLWLCARATANRGIDITSCDKCIMSSTFEQIVMANRYSVDNQVGIMYGLDGNKLH